MYIRAMKKPGFVRIEGLVDERIWGRFKGWAIKRHDGRSRQARGMSYISLELAAAMESAMQTPHLPQGDGAHTQAIPHALRERVETYLNQDTPHVNPVQLYRAITGILNVHDPRAIRGWVTRLEVSGLIRRLDGAPVGTPVKFNVLLPTWEVIRDPTGPRGR